MRSPFARFGGDRRGAVTVILARRPAAGDRFRRRFGGFGVGLSNLAPPAGCGRPGGDGGGARPSERASGGAGDGRRQPLRPQRLRPSGHRAIRAGRRNAGGAKVHRRRGGADRGAGDPDHADSALFRSASDRQAYRRRLAHGHGRPGAVGQLSDRVAPRLCAGRRRQRAAQRPHRLDRQFVCDGL